jgi:hypothetical protein
LDDAAHTEVFIAQKTGEIVSWRNDTWRSFDRLWSLHVFGFVDRESPRQWPLRIAASFAAIAALSGAGLLVTRLLQRALRALRARRQSDAQRAFADGVRAP